MSENNVPATVLIANPESDTEINLKLFIDSEPCEIEGKSIKSGQHLSWDYFYAIAGTIESKIGSENFNELWPLVMFENERRKGVVEINYQLLNNYSHLKRVQQAIGIYNFMEWCLTSGSDELCKLVTLHLFRDKVNVSWYKLAKKEFFDFCRYDGLDKIEVTDRKALPEPYPYEYEKHFLQWSKSVKKNKFFTSTQLSILKLIDGKEYLAFEAELTYPDNTTEILSAIIFPLVGA